MKRDHQDALIDQLLREILGGDRPRDITGRVLHQAKLYDRFRRRWWIGAGSALAACVAIAAGLAVYWPRDYPGPQADDNVYVLNGGDFQRGAAIGTDEENSGSLNLGGYVKVVMAPETNLTIGGSKYQEKVLVDSGHLDVDVTPNKGKFDIAVGPANVHVTGTKFGVDVRDGLDDTQTYRVKMLYVNVKEGSVDVQGVQTPKKLAAGDNESFVISSEPVKVIMPNRAPAAVTQNASPTPPLRGRMRPGLQAGIQQGAQIGARGGPTRALLETGAGVRGMVNAQTGSLVKPLMMVITQGRMERRGFLRLNQGIYYLESGGANFVLFPQSAPTIKEWQPISDREINVVWESGKVVSTNALPVR